ncbi:MAG: type 4a pilus biogenesis protein PilO [Gammaproteobacteria bacterium]|nr:type 4a pilus biogenesis protein PilO [Gammaproteobacteria bacterium]
MNLVQELKALDINNIGSWPILFKAVSIGFISVVVLALGIHFDTTKQYNALDSAEKKELELKNTFEEKQKKAVNLNAYRRQKEDMQKIFGEMLRQLPSKTEVAALLVDISQVGLASGLEFELFKPLNENPVEFYAELPIQIRVVGNYHEFGNFVSGVAALPRIVTIHDFSIARQGKGKEGLVMEATAKTYRYLDEDEIAQGANKKRKKGGK